MVPSVMPIRSRTRSWARRRIAWNHTNSRAYTSAAAVTNSANSQR